MYLHGNDLASTEKTSKWKGFTRYDSIYKGNEVIVVFPNIKPNGRWIWRTEFFDAFAYVDIAMVELGYILAYYKISDLYGCPLAVNMMHEFHEYFTNKYHVISNPILFGFSRGGLYAFNYAYKYPKKVSSIYLDAPVLDIRSWPGGLMQGEGSPSCWEECLQVYGFNDNDDIKNEYFEDKIHVLIKADIPIIIVAGDSDKVVPFKENGKILKNHYEKNNCKIKVILKKGVGHHPHSLKDPTEVVSFLVDNQE